MQKLWLVTIHDDDWDYDQFVEAAVWAETADEAEATFRAARRHPEEPADHPIYGKAMWIEDPAWRLSVKPAPPEGVVLVHWHAG